MSFLLTIRVSFDIMKIDQEYSCYESKSVAVFVFKEPFSLNEVWEDISVCVSEGAL